MKYAKLLQTLNTKPVAILPEAHKYILETADNVIAGSCDFNDLFDDVLPVFEDKGKVAVINIQGVILPNCTKFEKLLGATSAKEIRQAIKQAKNSQAETVIFYINSAGGAVQGIQETAKAIQDLKKTKTTIAYTDDLMCSAAYWLGAQCHNVFASESAEIGSIGVYLSILTLEKSLAMQGIEANVIQAGKYKTLGIACKDLTPEEISYLQEGVNSSYADFKAAVAHRGLEDETMQGESYDGINAVENKLVDGNLADLNDLINYYF